MARSSAAIGAVMLLGFAGCGGAPVATTAVPAVDVAAPSSAAESRPAEPRPGDPRPATPAQVEPHGAPPLEITFDDIKLDMQKGDPFTRDLLPRRVTDLERRRVRIRGYILPSFQQTGIEQFVLVRDNQECCFGPGATASWSGCGRGRARPSRSAPWRWRARSGSTSCAGPTAGTSPSTPSTARKSGREISESLPGLNERIS
jgi:hypothetical protein